MKKSTLYAPRLRGDIDLSREPSRIVGNSEKDWSRMDFPGEHIPGRPTQEIGAQSELANYRIGTRRVQDERVYHYCKASSLGCNKAYGSAQNYFDYHTTEASGDCISGLTVGTKAINTFILVVADDNDDHVEDWFAGGWAIVKAATIQMYRVLSSTAGGGDDDQVTLYLAEPLNIEVAASTSIQVYPSIYGKVQRVWGTGDGARPVVCVPPRTVTASYHFWGQTYGPCYGIMAGAFPSGDRELRLAFDHFGSLTLAYPAGAGHYEQLAGYRAFHYLVAEPNGLVLYNLTLAP